MRYQALRIAYRVSRAVVGLLFFSALFGSWVPIPVAAQTSPICCLCAKAGQNVCVNATLAAGESAGADCSGLTGTQTYRTAVGDQQALFEGFRCTAVLDAQGCTVVGTNASSQCPAGTPVNLGALASRFSAPASSSAGGTAATAPAQEQPFVPVTPQLGVPIPGLTFTPATREGGVVTVPFLAQYINAAYRYAVSVILVIAIIMVVWGGFRFLLGSASVGNISKAKEVIRDAVVGMLLVIGAYIILQTVNPATTELRSLELSSIVEQQINLETEADFEPTGGLISEQQADAQARAFSPTVSVGGRNRTGHSRISQVPVSEFLRLNTECLHTNTPAHPTMIDYLRRVSDEFCRLRGSHTDWRIYCGGYRRPDQQFDFWYNRCFYRENCTTPTTLPLPRGNNLIGRDAQRRMVYLPNPALRDREALRALIVPHFDTTLSSHISGVGLDCRCGVSRGFSTFHGPCTMVMEQAMKNAGMCRLRTEPWHFEPNQYRVSVFSCLSNWTIGTYQQRSDLPVDDYRQCTYYSYGQHRCIRQ